MRASLALALVLPMALTGCPALLGDWSVGSNPADASTDVARPDAAGGRSSSGSGGSWASGGTQSSGGTPGTGGTSNVGGTGDAGGTMSTGGAETGGQQGGTGGTGGAGAGTDAGPDGCSAPTTTQLTTALTAALPSKVAWASFESSASTATCVAFAACGPLNGSTPTPNCGTIAIQWGSVSVLPSGDVYVSFTAQVNTPAKYGCSGAITNSCSISASTTAGTMKVHADVTIPSPFPYWAWALNVESLTTWDATSTCPNFDPTTANGSLNGAIVAAVEPISVHAPLSCP